MYDTILFIYFGVKIYNDQKKRSSENLFMAKKCAVKTL